MCTLVQWLESDMAMIILFISNIVCCVSSKLTNIWLVVGVGTICVAVVDNMVSFSRCARGVFHGRRDIKRLMCLCDWDWCDS